MYHKEFSAKAPCLIRSVIEVKSKTRWRTLVSNHLKLSGTLFSGFILFCDLYSTKQSKTKNTKLTPSPTKMQQADVAVRNRETRCMKVSTLRIIQRVTKPKWVMGKNIELVNTISCNFSQITQDDTNHSFLIYRYLQERYFQDKYHISTYRHQKIANCKSGDFRYIHYKLHVFTVTWQQIFNERNNRPFYPSVVNISNILFDDHKIKIA